MKRILIIFISFFCFGNVNAQESSIDYIIKNLGVNVDGHFNEFVITADFDSDGKLNDIVGTIDVSSIETGIDSRDEHILEEDYFYAKKHRKITLKSTAIKILKVDSYEVTAHLTIKGKTKKITIPIAIEKVGGKYKITSYFEINRKDFDIGGGSFIMGKTVKISVTHYQDI